MTERLKERIAEEWAMLDPVDPLRRLLSDVIDVLAQPAQEPSQASYPEYDRGFSEGWDRCKAAAQRPWVGLTDDEHCDIWYKESLDWMELDWMEYGKAIEAKLKEKNFD